MRIAALYVETDGVYYGLPEVDPWDEARDARLYAGPHPVVAHPPCARWCQLAPTNEKRYGHKVGDDDGMFESALRSVRAWGGVLEHPAFSYAWSAFNLCRPKQGRWIRNGDEWVTQVSQTAYGHKARKLTWLLYCGSIGPPPIDWSTPEAKFQVSRGKKPGGTYWKPYLTSKETKATPLPFRDLLLSIARSAI